MLDLAASDAAQAVAGEELAFCCALARQCFINEYVFACSEEEEKRAHELRDRLTAALQSDKPVPPLWPVAVAAYEPLHGVPTVDALLARSWPDPLAALFRQQIAEPREEMRIRGETRRLTEVEDEVSRQVRQQYEENPYPRWVETTEAWGKPASIDEYLRRLFPLAPVATPGKSGAIDILIAGAGTGRQAIEIARQFPEARVLAVDLSRAALSYAKRKSDELRVKNIEYGQADILKLGKLEQRFDVIEAAGSLQCLKDPAAGWRVLLSLLRPGGVMFLGLYSKVARADINAARDYIAQRGHDGVCLPVAVRRVIAETESAGTPAITAKQIGCDAGFINEDIAARIVQAHIRMRSSRSNREPIHAVIGLCPPSVEDGKVEAAVDASLHAARSGRFERAARVVEPNVDALD